MDDTTHRLKMVNALADIDRASWDAVANPQGLAFDPCLSWDFLEALESSGAATRAEGWAPHHLVIEGPGGEILAAMPLYLKSHSYGEFVFDHSWADAYTRGGGSYYPKLLCAVPFTPVTGRRLLVRPGPDAEALTYGLLRAAIDIGVANNLSSLHINFLEPQHAAELEDLGFLHRTDQQFHWFNNGYASFDDFLSELSSAKRKNLRKERAKAQEGLTFVHKTGSDITEADWDAFFEFYMDTGARKWGSPYLTRETFSLLGQRMSDRILLVLAMEHGRPIAGAMNLIGSDRLLGRYWGTNSLRPMLHFETCYYQAIDFAIERGLAIVEAGAQGGHKLARGYVPVTTHSVHWIGNANFRKAIAEYLTRERRAVEEDQDWLRTRTPFKKSNDTQEGD